MQILVVTLFTFMLLADMPHNMPPMNNSRGTSAGKQFVSILL